MAEQGMHDLTGWQRVPCAVADLMRQAERVRWPLRVFSSLTDPEGQYGTPIVYTEWGIEHPDGNMPLLREYRWLPEGNRDCEHYVPEWRNEDAR